MEITAREGLQFLRNIKSVAFATVNRGNPAVRIADVMLVNEEGMYLLTARGKPYHRQLKEHARVAVCAMDQHFITVRVVGDIRECKDRSILDTIYEHNPVLEKLYPGDTSRILSVFLMFRGVGEIFDLSTEPPHRRRFAFGGAAVNPPGYAITDACTACGTCAEACPVGVIAPGDVYRIDGAHCLECGACAEVCPEEAIHAAQGLG